MSMRIPQALLLASAGLLALAPPATAQADLTVIDPIDLHSCTSTSRCTGVLVDPSGPCATAWYVDEEDDPSLDTCGVGSVSPIDLHSCTSTSRCTGVAVDPSGLCVTVWYVDEEDSPTVDTCLLFAQA